MALDMDYYRKLAREVKGVVKDVPGKPRYDVRIVPAEVEEGEYVWRAKVHYLRDKENGGNHSVFLDLVDRDGVVVRTNVPHPFYYAKTPISWTWDGRNPVKESAPDIGLLKGIEEHGADINLYWDQRVSVWCNLGPSDRVEDIHIMWEGDGPGSQSYPGHVSCLVVFVEERQGKPPVEPPVEDPESPVEQPDVSLRIVSAKAEIVYELVDKEGRVVIPPKKYILDISLRGE